MCIFACSLKKVWYGLFFNTYHFWVHSEIIHCFINCHSINNTVWPSLQYEGNTDYKKAGSVFMKNLNSRHSAKWHDVPSCFLKHTKEFIRKMEAQLYVLLQMTKYFWKCCGAAIVMFFNHYWTTILIYTTLLCSKLYLSVTMALSFVGKMELSLQSW